MKHILIDGTTVSKHIDGLTQYICNVTLNLDTSLANYTLLLRQGECPEVYAKLLAEKNITIEYANFRSIGPLRDLQAWIWLKRNKHRFDALFCPSNQFLVATSLPAVYTIHDLIYEQYPSQLGKWSRLKRMCLHWNVRCGLKKAKHVIAVSEFTKKEVLKYHPNTLANKIKVIYEGWEHLCNIKPKETPLPFEQYLLYVGSSRGHKNLNRLIEAIERSADKLPQNFGVVIAGNYKMMQPQLKQQIANINHNRPTISLTGWISDEELAYYFTHAKAFIFPSLSEGFGIPVLEAYHYNIPLLLSNCGSLPEVAGNAAIYFDPYNIDDMAQKIIDTAHTNNFNQLLTLQQNRLQMYSWRQTAQEVEQLLLDT